MAVHNKRGSDWGAAPLPPINRKAHPDDGTRIGPNYSMIPEQPMHQQLNITNPNVFNTPRAVVSLQSVGPIPRIAAPIEKFKPPLPRDSRTYGFRDPRREDHNMHY